MRPDERDAGYLWKMLRAARDALTMSEGLTFEKLQTDIRDQYSLTHAIAQVGEAASQVSPEFRAAHPEIPWRRMTGMRHRLVHDYGGTDWEIVWTVLQTHLPVLVRALEPLIPPPPGDGADA